VFGGLDIGFGFQYVRMINKTISVDVVGSIGEIFFWLPVIVQPDNKIKRKNTTTNYRKMKVEYFF
jgi:hypothetical protein